MGGLKRLSLDQSTGTHWGTGANQIHIQTHTHTHTQKCSVLHIKLPFPYWWNWFQLHNYTIHTRIQAHTQTDQRDHEPFIKVKFSLLFPPHEFCLSPAQKAFSTSLLVFWFPHSQLLHLHDWIPITQATQRCSVTPHIISHWSEARCHTCI